MFYTNNSESDLKRKKKRHESSVLLKSMLKAAKHKKSSSKIRNVISDSEAFADFVPQYHFIHSDNCSWKSTLKP